jgi:tRNA pseudouridine55 synthase
MNGVLVVDKPSGPTSHDVVAAARRSLHVDRIGHTGTLDPLATGVLPLVIGRATRLAQFLTGDQKEYLASVRFGAATDTYDSLGEPVEGSADARLPGSEEIEEALEGFRGTYLQMPPPFSAKKVKGTRAYTLARANEQVALEPVSVTVEALELKSVEGDSAVLRVVSSSGFYVRTLAHDLGRRLGCGAHLAALRRVRSGEFREEAAVRLRTLLEDPEAAAARLVSLERLLTSLPHVVVNERGTRRASHGNTLSRADLVTAWPEAGTGRVRLFDPAGGLLGIARQEGDGLLRPVVVLV